MNIYLIRCHATGLPYVGQTGGTIEYRLNSHTRDAKRSTHAKQKFATAIREHGAGAFIVGLLEECDDAVANERENFWINHYNSVEEGYNTMKKGISNRKGKTNSTESNAKRSATLQQRRAAGLSVGCPKGTTPWNKKYATHEDMLAARRARLNPKGKKKQRCPKTGRWVTNK